MDSEILQLQKKFERRWQNIVKRSAERNVSQPDREALWRKLLARFSDGFECAYCKRKMLIEDSRPRYPQVFSIDHKISLDDGGDNSNDNLEIVCHRCNIVKGTIRYDTFQDMIAILPPTLLDRMFKEIWNGRMADKLNRVERFK